MSWCGRSSLASSVMSYLQPPSSRGCCFAPPAGVQRDKQARGPASLCSDFPMSETSPAFCLYHSLSEVPITLAIQKPRFACLRHICTAGRTSTLPLRPRKFATTPPPSDYSSSSSSYGSTHQRSTMLPTLRCSAVQLF